MGNYKLYQGDCLEVMKNIEDESVDLILTDPPYGTTACKWDIIIPFELMWEQYKRIIKENGCIALFATEPFASQLICSNLKMFKYDLIWDKVNLYTGSLLANKRPLRRHEQILIFYNKQPIYNKQMRKGTPYKMTRNTNGVGEYASKSYKRVKTINNGEHNPCSIIEIEGGNKKEKGLHPTQKPVVLLEWIIKTYTNENMTVLDSCMGSGSTGVACINTNRNFIGIELDEKYFEIAQNRIEEAANKTK